MNKNKINDSHMISDLRNKFTPKKEYKLAEVNNKLQKIAFDVVRFMDGSDIEGLWKIEKKDDGEYIVATYDDNSQLEPKTASNSNQSWKIYASEDKSFINISYNNYPLKKIAIKDLGLEKSDIDLTIRYMPQNLKTSKNLLSSLLIDIPIEDRKKIAGPEFDQIMDRNGIIL